MVRGPGKFKQKRGGGRSFTRDMVLDENGTAISKRSLRDKNEDDDDDSGDEAGEEDDEEEGSDEDESEEERKEELTREQRRDMKKAVQKAKGKADQEEDGEEKDPDLINPNRLPQKMNKLSGLGEPKEMSRREREQKEKAEAKERYWKLHLQGKTQEAKSDLARLAKIRAERDAAQAKRKAESDAKAAEMEAKKKAQVNKRGA